MFCSLFYYADLVGRMYLMPCKCDNKFQSAQASITVAADVFRETVLSMQSDRFCVK